jgi:two-component system, chemotaxis family, chemotaxis protein CheY
LEAVLPPAAELHNLSAAIVSLGTRFDMELKALVTDSSADARRNITRLLKELGVKDVVEASDSTQAMKLFQTGTYDLVFAEWNSEVGAGEKLVKSIRKIDSRVPIIVTAPHTRNLPEVKKSCPSASTYIMLPFTPEQLKKTIGTFVPTLTG